eukprot:464589_1
MVITLNCLNMANLLSIVIEACFEILFRSYSLQFEPYLWWVIYVFVLKYLKCVGNPKATCQQTLTSSNKKTQHITLYEENIGILKHRYYIYIHCIHHAYELWGIFQEIILALTTYYIILYYCTHSETLGECTLFMYSFTCTRCKILPTHIQCISPKCLAKLHLSYLMILLFSFKKHIITLIRKNRLYYCIYLCSKPYKYIKYTLLIDVKEENGNKMLFPSLNLCGAKDD